MSKIERKNKPIVILSAYLADYSETTNQRMHEMTCFCLKGGGIDIDGDAIGSYKGEEEQAIIAEYDDNDDLEFILDIARNCEQESVLLVSADRHSAALYYLDTKETVMLGSLVPVSEWAANYSESWTRTANGQYYITVEE